MLEKLTSKPISPQQVLRRQIASRYLSGNGIEIGALHLPLEVPANATVRYVDRMMVTELRKQYPELSEYELVEVDIIADGETLLSITDSSVDFVIANHLIEHCQNPIFSIENWLRVLKPSGILYMAVPDKRYTFDYERPVTSLEHLIRDYNEGPRWSKDSHFKEWTRLVKKVAEHDVAARAKVFAELNYSIHFHVWTQVEFLELLLYCQSNLCFPFEIELLQKNRIEFMVILSKTAAVDSQASVVIPGVKDIKEIKFRATSKNSPGFFAAINGSSAPKLKVSKASSLTASGWAVLADEGRPADRVLITYGDNNLLVAVAPVNLERPDVVKVLKDPAYKNSGWSATFNPSTLPGDEVVLKAWAYNSARKEAIQLNLTHEVVVLY
jgi:predicted SAM-dependent methyltransferase